MTQTASELKTTSHSGIFSLPSELTISCKAAVERLCFFENHLRNGEKSFTYKSEADSGEVSILFLEDRSVRLVAKSVSLGKKESGRTLTISRDEGLNINRVTMFYHGQGEFVLDQNDSLHDDRTLRAISDFAGHYSTFLMSKVSGSSPK